MSQRNEKMETPKGRGQIRKRDEISPYDESIILTQDAISPEEVEIIKKHRENQKNKKQKINDIDTVNTNDGNKQGGENFLNEHEMGKTRKGMEGKNGTEVGPKKDNEEVNVVEGEAPQRHNPEQLRSLRNETRKERQQTQKIRNMTDKIKATFFGREESPQRVKNNLLIALENMESTSLNVEKATKMQIISVLGPKIHPSDIKEIRINKFKQRATIELNNSNSCHTKSKEFIEGIEEHNSLAVKLGDQVFWVAKTIKRQSIGVVRGIPENESIDDMT